MHLNWPKHAPSPIRFRTPTFLPSSLLAVTALALAGCSDSSTTDPKGSTLKLSGVAAVGLPIVNGNVTAKCNDGKSYVGTTNNNGQWNANIALDAIPCAVRVTGGTQGSGGSANTRTFYSIAKDSASTITANITPLTDLALARALNTAQLGTPADWFGGSNASSSISSLIGRLDTTVALLKSVIIDAGHTWPASSFNPFTTPFSAAAGNTYDDLLEALAESLRESGVTYE